MKRAVWAGLAGLMLFTLLLLAATAPDRLPGMDAGARALGPGDFPPFGTDRDGRSLLVYAQQGAAIVALPTLLSGVIVAFLATIAGLARCAAIGWLDSGLQAFQELVGALPRLVVVLVVAMLLPYDWRTLMPIAFTWAILAAPAAMDEAAATAGRLGGARFVEALRAHGFTAGRIYLYHVTLLNLRPVIARQAAEVMMQVIFLEIALSYLADASGGDAASFTHSADTKSWASLLYEGYTWLAAGLPLAHAMALGLGLVGCTVLGTQAFRLAARAR
ncbi:MAG: hypothetical protein EP330_02210 [Deltaproteobacteria bacterium]|nr:MAG: hypothetical protein EP330_02210 [Deltaproteobacteria bacterium]